MPNQPPSPGVPPGTPVPQPYPPPGYAPGQAGVQPAPGQVYVQPVPVPVAPPVQQAPPAPAASQEERNEQEIHHLEDRKQLQLRIYSHSNLFYWWPVWAVGYLMALLTYLQGVSVQGLGDVPERFHPSSNVGIVFFVTLFLVILMTNVSLRGTASVIAVLTIILITVLLAWFGWWTVILDVVGRLRVHLNLGAYLTFSTLMFVVWAFTVFVFDRSSYWLIKPGQITQEFVFGAGSKSYDTTNMVLEKFQGDLFRNWVIGLGTGDLRIHTMGANRDTIDIPNVLFVTRKVALIQEMISIKPDAFGSVTVK
jgi:hypothetical protein